MKILRPAMKLLPWIRIYIFIFTCGYVAECCGKHKMHRYCRNTGPIPQRTCTGVQSPTCTLWALKCACRRDKYLRDDGQCVPENQCNASPKAIQEAKEKARKEKEETIEARYNRTLQFLQQHEVLDLILIAQDAWFESECYCFRSRFYATHPNGAERSLDCYIYATRIQVPDTTAHLLGTKDMAKRTHFVDFLATRQRDQINVQLKSLEKDGGRPIDIPVDFLVLGAEADCMVVGFGKAYSGIHDCFLWGLLGDRARQHDDCSAAMDQKCDHDVYDISKNNTPCAQFDEREKRLEEKARREMEAEQAALEAQQP